MNNLEDFKNFVKSHPNFAKYVENGTMTWQKFYELYDMYGEDSTVWNDYQEEKKSTTLSDIISMTKNIDLDKLQDGVNSLSKAVGLFSDLVATKGTNIKSSYKPRAIYKRFED